MTGSASLDVSLAKVPQASATMEDPTRNFGGTVLVRGDETEPVVARLKPLGRLQGRFVDEQGLPIAGAKVSVNAESRSASELYRFASFHQRTVETDADGRFDLPEVVPDLSSLDEGDVKMAVDIRQVYATILNRWLDLPAAEVLGGEFEALSIL
jgi:hypothetical protein